MTPPRIRGLIDRVARQAKIVCYAKAKDKSEAEAKLTKAKVEAIRAFGLISHDADRMMELGNIAVRHLRADFDAQAAELAKWEKAFTEVHKPALEEAHQYIGDLRAELAEARELLRASAHYATKMEPMSAKLLNAIDAFLDK